MVKSASFDEDLVPTIRHDGFALLINCCEDLRKRKQLVNAPQNSPDSVLWTLMPDFDLFSVTASWT